MLKPLSRDLAFYAVQYIFEFTLFYAHWHWSKLLIRGTTAKSIETDSRVLRRLEPIPIFEGPFRCSILNLCWKFLWNINYKIAQSNEREHGRRPNLWHRHLSVERLVQKYDCTGWKWYEPSYYRVRFCIYSTQRESTFRSNNLCWLLVCVCKILYFVCACVQHAIESNPGFVQRQGKHTHMRREGHLCHSIFNTNPNSR